MRELRLSAPTRTYEALRDGSVFSPHYRPIMAASMRDILPPGPLRSKIMLAICNGPTRPTHRAIADVFNMSAVRVGQIIRKEKLRAAGRQ